MASERIAVIEDFINEFKIEGKLKNMALGNAYYMAARLSYFDPSIPGREWMIKSLKFRKWWPEESKFIHVLFLLTFPLSYKVSKLIRKL